MKRAYVRRGTLTDNVEPQPGQCWRSRDPRDNGRMVTVVSVDAAFGTAALESSSGRKSRVKIARFVKSYVIV